MSDESVPSAAPIARDTSTQCMPGPAISSEGRTKPPRTSSRRAILNSGRASLVGARQDHVHRQPPAALGDEPLLRRRHHLRRGLPGRVALEEDLEPALVDPDRVAHRLDLRVALHRPREVELDVEGDHLHAVDRREPVVVANGHHVVEAVDADPPPALVLRAPGDVLSGAIVEHLLETGRPVLADVARLGGEDDRGVAVRRHHDVRVAVHDLEA